MTEGPIRATIDDFEQIVDVADICFPRDKERGGMLPRWPHIYVKEPDFIQKFFLIREGDTICAETAYVDEALVIHEKVIRVAGVTAVCTRPEYRGRGMMSTLMPVVNREMQEEGYAFAELGGRRTRYNHFGYENAGRDLRFEIRARSLLALDEPTGYEVLQYGGEESHVEATFDIHSRDTSGLRRDVRTHERLLGRKGWETFLAVSEGEVRSYVSLVRGGDPPNCRVSEFGGESQGVHAVCAHQVTALGIENIKVDSPIGHPVNRFLYAACDGWSLVAKRMVKILDLAAVIDGFSEQMRVRYEQAGFETEREFSVRIEGTGQSALVRLSSERVTVELARGDVHVELPELEMVRFLFGMGGPGDVVPLVAAHGFLRSILPLDFYVWSLELA